MENFSNYFDEIKKQMAQMQQNNNVQFQLINLIFKNMEGFYEHLNSTSILKFGHIMHPESHLLLQSKINEGGLPASHINNLPPNLINSMNNNAKTIMSDGHFPSQQMHFPQSSQSNFPMNMEQILMNNNYGLNNFNQVFHNNLNLFPSMNPMIMPQAFNFPPGFSDNAFLNQMANSNNRMAAQFSMNPLAQNNSLNSLLSNLNPNSNKN